MGSLTVRGVGRLRGFTLLELMVVVVIVAVLSTIAGLTLAPQSEDRVLRREAERLALLLEAISLEAVVSGRVLGWSHSGHAYRFWSRDPVNGWGGMQGDDLFRAREFDARSAIARVVAGGRVLEAEERLVFRSAGGGDYVIEMRLGGAALSVRGDAAGRVRIDDAGPVATQ